MSLLLQLANNRPKLFDDTLLNDFFWPAEFKRNLTRSAFGGGLGAVDIEEDKDRVRILMDLPGFRKEDLNLSFERGILTVSGERKTESAKEDTRCYVSERQSGAFSRSFQLGEKMDGESVAAKLENGVLEISLKKRADVLPKTIAID